MRQLFTKTLNGCVNLTRLPTLHRLRRLRSLRLRGCVALRELEPDLASLNELALLDVEGCATLHVMPDLSELPKAGGKAPMRSQSGVWLLQVHGLPERPCIAAMPFSQQSGCGPVEPGVQLALWKVHTLQPAVAFVRSPEARIGCMPYYSHS